MKELKLVQEFHEKFEQYIGKSPSIPSKDIIVLRNRLIVEELNEVLEEAVIPTKDRNIDIKKLSKELGDLFYVWAGMVISYGLQDIMPEIIQEIHNSNLSKLGSDGKPIKREDGKVIKSELYKEADINKILNG
jgi:predicted HAD superfamily Cof-like phosphohydrolase